ncbi:hypothetical protein ACNH6C_07965 [Bdellovibrio bacteriovorus]|uniref:hypothetical protein n=1 Tax=Bdellovibrio bacteriovorus TaxID=959 RepID=UPI003A8053E2
MKRASVTLLMIIAMASSANAWIKRGNGNNNPPAPPPPGAVASQTMGSCADNLFNGLDLWPSSAEYACGLGRVDVQFQKCVIDLTKVLDNKANPNKDHLSYSDHNKYVGRAADVCVTSKRADAVQCMLDLSKKRSLTLENAAFFCERGVENNLPAQLCTESLEKSFPRYGQAKEYSLFICRQSASPTFDKCVSQLYNQGALEVENNRLQYDALRLCKNGTNTALNKCIVDEVQNRGRTGVSAAAVCMERHDAETRARAEAERRRIEEQRRIEAAKAEAAKKAAEEKRRLEEQRKADEVRRQQQQQQEQARKLEEARKQEEQRRKEEENRKQQEKPQPIPQQPSKPTAPTTPSQPSVDSGKQQEEQKRKDEEKRRQEEQRKADEKRKADEQKKKDEEKKKEEEKKNQESQQPAPLDPVTTPPPPPPDGGLIVDLPMPE